MGMLPSAEMLSPIQCSPLDSFSAGFPYLFSPGVSPN